MPNQCTPYNLKNLGISREVRNVLQKYINNGMNLDEAIAAYKAELQFQIEESKRKLEAGLGSNVAKHLTNYIDETRTAQPTETVSPTKLFDLFKPAEPETSQEEEIAKESLTPKEYQQKIRKQLKELSAMIPVGHRLYETYREAGVTIVAYINQIVDLTKPPPSKDIQNEFYSALDTLEVVHAAIVMESLDTEAQESLNKFKTILWEKPEYADLEDGLVTVALSALATKGPVQTALVKTIKDITARMERGDLAENLVPEALEAILEHIEKGHIDLMAQYKDRVSHGTLQAYKDNPNGFLYKEYGDEAGSTNKNPDAQTLSINSIPDGMVLRSDKPKSFLALIPNLTAYFKYPNLLARLLPEDVKLTPALQQGIKDFLDLKDYVAKALKTYNPQILKEDPEHYVKKLEVGNPHRYRSAFLASVIIKAPYLYFQDINGNIPENITTAITLHLMSWIGTQGRATSTNDIKAIARILGVSESDQDAIPAEALAILRDIGVSRIAVQSSLGKAIYKTANLKALPNPDGYIDERFAQALGLLAVEIGVDIGLLEEQYIVTEEVEAKLNNEERAKVATTVEQLEFWVRNILSENDVTQALSNYETGRIPFIRVSSVDSEEFGQVPDENIENITNIYEDTENFFSKITDLSDWRRGPEEAPIREVNRKVDGSFMMVDDKSAEQMEKLQQDPRILDVDWLNPVFEMFSLDTIKKILGWEDPTKKHITQEKGTQTENARISRGITYLQDWLAKANQNDNLPFYFRYLMKVNGRRMIDSNTLNPESDKFHRIAVTHKAWTDSFTKEDMKGSDKYSEFLFAIGFAMGVKVDRKITEVINKEVEALMQSDKIKAAWQIFKNREPGIPLTTEQESIIVDALKEKMWSVKALMTWAEFEKFKESEEAIFTHNIPIEVDGITNNLAIKSLQMPVDIDNSTFWNIMNRVGIYKDSFVSMGEWSFKESRLDNYQQVITDTNNELKTILGEETPTSPTSPAKTIVEKPIEGTKVPSEPLKDMQTTQRYDTEASVTFRRTNEPFGGLSNMAGGYGITVNGGSIRTAEALYQALRFPNHPDIQRLILNQASPMTAKGVSREHINDTRTDWDLVKINIMRWVLRAKLYSNKSFYDLLMSTDDKPIVENSSKDKFWGAVPISYKTLEGQNVLGKLLMELRDDIQQGRLDLSNPLIFPEIPNSLLLGTPIAPIKSNWYSKPPASSGSTLQSRITFGTSNSPGYPQRTRENASADATIAIAFDFSTGGEKLTKKEVKKQGKKYIGIDPGDFSIDEDSINTIVEELNSVNAKTLNIAGNGLYSINKNRTANNKISQDTLDEFTYKLLKEITESPNLKNKITHIRSGGQTGFDEAGAKAGARLGIPTLVWAPSNWNMRDPNGRDTSKTIPDQATRERVFKERFNVPLEDFGSNIETSSTTDNGLSSIIKDRNAHRKEAFNIELQDEPFEDMGSIFYGDLQNADAYAEPLYRKIQSVLPTFIDEETGIPTSEARSEYAKPIVMVFNYNAGNRSIAMTTGNTTLRHIYQQVMKIAEIEDRETRINEFESLLTNVETALEDIDIYDDDFNLNKALNTAYQLELKRDIEEFKNLPDEQHFEFLRNWKLDINEEKVLRNRVGASLGTAVIRGLRKSYAPIKAADEVIVKAFQVQTAIFLAEFEQAVANWLEAYPDQTPSPADWEALYQQMVQENKIPGVPHPNSDLSKPETFLNVLNLIPRPIKAEETMKGEPIPTTSKQHKTYAEVQLAREDGGRRAQSSLSRQVPTPNIGAKGPVLATHGSDGAHAGALSSYGELQPVFDAFIYGTGASQELKDAINGLFYDVQSNYEFVNLLRNRTKEFIDRYRNADGVTAERIAELMRNVFKNKKKTIKEQSNIFLADLDFYADRVQENRTRLKTEIYSVNQFGHDRHPKIVNPDKKSPEGGIANTNPGNYNELFNGNLTNRADLQNVWTLTGNLDQNAGATISTEHQGRLNTIITDIILPGMHKISTQLGGSPVTAKIISDPNSDTVLGETQDRQINIQTGLNLSPGRMSNQETLTHELVHAVLGEYLEGNGINSFWRNREIEQLYEAARTQLTLESFIPAGEQGNPVYRTKAQRYWDHIFNNPDQHHLHEFVVLGLTNNEFITALENLRTAPILEQLKSDFGNLHLNRNFFQVFYEMLRHAMNWVLALKTGSKASNAHEALMRLARDMVTTTERHIPWALERQTTERLRFVDVKSYEYLQEGIPATVHLVQKGIAKAGVNPDNITDMVDQIYTNWIRNHQTLVDMFGELTDMAKPNISQWKALHIKKLAKIDAPRKHLLETTTKQVEDLFSRKLTEEEWIALNEVLLRGDLSSLNASALIDYLTNLTLRNVKIEEIEDDLRRLFPTQAENFIAQSKALGAFIITQQVPKGIELVMTNAHNISRQLYLPHAALRTSYTEDQANNARELIDQLSSLYSMFFMRNEIKDTTVNLLRTESTAIGNMLGLHQGLKASALQLSFDNNPTMMMKGYTPESFNPEKDIRIDLTDTATQRKWKKEGFTLLTNPAGLPKDQYLDPTTEARGIYVSTMVHNRYNAGMISQTSPQKKGTSLTDAAFMEGTLQAGFRRRSLAQSISKATTRANNLYRNTRPIDLDMSPDKLTSPLIPIINPEGKVVDLRYMMSDNHKRALLDRKDLASDVLGKIISGILDKKESKSINIELARQLWRDRINADRNQKYVILSPNSQDPKMKEAYALLPDEFLREWKRVSGLSEVPVPKQLAMHILGYRPISLTGELIDLRKKYDLEMVLPEGVVAGVRLADDVWKEIIQFAKARMIIAPKVVIGNFISNVFLLMSYGIPISFILKQGTEAITSMRKYQRERSQFTLLNNQIAMERNQGRNARELEAKVAFIQKALERNPVHQMVQDGIFTAIVEDIIPDSFKVPDYYPLRKMISKAGEKLGKITGRSTDPATRWIGFLTMSPGSKSFAWAMAANQYGDFMGRYIKYRWSEMGNPNPGTPGHKTKEQIIQDALETFVFYEELQSKYLQAGNDYGLIWFSKYVLRTQRVILNVLRNNPAYSAMAYGMSSMIPTGDHIFNSILTPASFANRTTLPHTALGRVQDQLGLPALDWIGI